MPLRKSIGAREVVEFLNCSQRPSGSRKLNAPTFKVKANWNSSKAYRATYEATLFRAHAGVKLQLFALSRVPLALSAYGLTLCANGYWQLKSLFETVCYHVSPPFARSTNAACAAARSE